ncbi:hypothetical protein [Streptomyces roseus]|uniref:Uncharacterized protein n=1 Tax=Streptomyces roseus TaxID=66430 RepID=A0A0J6XS15_9ACTN|nr:hypothetical protein [Streptomyces roseus]KMO97583.1 hypothetical protein ACS04_12270 [Streptomyces roseus]
MRNSRARRSTALLAPCVALVIAAGGFGPAAGAQARTDPSPVPVPVPTMKAPAPTRIPSPLKRIRPAVFRTTVERAAKESTLPGAAVLPRTPQGAYRAVGC